MLARVSESYGPGIVTFDSDHDLGGYENGSRTRSHRNTPVNVHIVRGGRFSGERICEAR